MLKIRLRQQGRTNRLTYRLVVTDSRIPRDGKYVEMLGWYDPSIEGKDNISLQQDRLSFWLEQGAELSEKAQALVARVAPGIVHSLLEKKRQKKLRLNAKRKAKKKAK